MIKFFLLLAGLLIFAPAHTLKSQNLIPNKSVTGICYAGNKINRIYIPPPPEYFKKDKQKGGGTVTIYYTGFSAQGKAALAKAGSILESILPAGTKVTIKASWEVISTAGVLGQSTITGYVGGWGIDALNPMAVYPVALAEKIAGKSLNTDEEGDLTLAINSSKNWYLGTDGNTPTTKYDLVTVALHEICHGLGFYDSMSTDATIGWYGIGSIPMIYDTFIENQSGNRLTDTSQFINYSSALRSQLTTAPLYFNGPLLKNYSVLNRYSVTKARLYVPSTWDDGSSISHLDEQPATLNQNALMTPFIDLGEAIHDPGKYTFSILGDLGWINTRFIHKKASDTEEHLTQITLTCAIKSDTLYNRNKVCVVYSFNKFRSHFTLDLYSPNSDENFMTTIYIPSYNSELQYYFFTEDCFSRLYRSPSLYKLNPYTVYIGTDTIKPVISNTPDPYYLETIDTIKFNATVTDNLGVDTVYVEYYIESKGNNGPLKYIGLKAGTSDSYSSFLNAKLLSLNGGDSLHYRIFAKDKASIPNKSVFPKTGFESVRIEDVGLTINSYSTDFSNASADFFNIGFTVSKPAGFSRYGLNSKHPYESPEDSTKSIEYTAMLRNPMKFNESGILITFNEIVLVEPGESGSLFGSSGFYDYVIAEGSRNFGKTWFALADGYDSRIETSWESAYNNNISGNNSTFVPTESMLKSHTVYYQPSDKISAGDTIMVRFRLYSDPFANGWGWVIEDLKINPLIDAIEKVSNGPLQVYPNPGKGLIKINTNSLGSENGKPLHYSVFNSSGICIKKDRTAGNAESLIDISGYPTGFYILVLYSDGGVKTIKYSLIK
jgi:hypothetical protein